MWVLELKKNLPIGDILELHDLHKSSKALKMVLGDAYFYHTNPIFRCVRNSFLKSGFRFSFRYAAQVYGWPLMSIDLITESKLLPFVDNVYHIRHLQKHLRLGWR